MQGFSIDGGVFIAGLIVLGAFLGLVGWLVRKHNIRRSR
jgi:hypothetical protein